MRKNLIIILAVALLGLAGIYAKNNSSTTSVKTNPTSLNQEADKAAATYAAGSYRDGTFTGNVADTLYGPVRVAVVISSGKISDVSFLELPSDHGRSQELSDFSAPKLKQSTLTAQDAKDIQFVSGATSTSYGYQESLQSALDQAAGGTAINITASSDTV